MIRSLIFAVALAMPCVAQPASIDLSQSTVTVHVYKSGLFAALAHNHTIKAPIASGSVDRERRIVSITFHANDLRVADAEGSESDHRQIEDTMKGPEVLDAAQFPVISFQSKQVETAKGESYEVAGDLKLHGRNKEITLPVAFSGGIYRGSVRLKQSDFGITPVTIAGGAVRVKDEIEIDFEIKIH